MTLRHLTKKRFFSDATSAKGKETAIVIGRRFLRAYFSFSQQMQQQNPQAAKLFKEIMDLLVDLFPVRRIAVERLFW